MMNPVSPWRLARGAFWALPATLALWVLAAGSDVVSRMDLLVYDLLVVAAPKLPPQGAHGAVVVAIDERSLRAIGRWPWSRRIQAQLLNDLGRAGARAVAYAVLFDMPDPHDPEADELFAQAVGRSGRVVLPVAPAARQDGADVSVLLPFAPLDSAAAALAHVDVGLDADGVARRLDLQAGLGAARWPALSLAMLDLLYPAEAGPLLGLSQISREERSPASWQRDFVILLESGRIGEIPRVSAADVLANPGAQGALLAGKAVFVGVTAVGSDGALAVAKSLGGTPVPAVLFHAEAFEALHAGAVATPLGRGTVVLLGAGLLLLGFLLNRVAEPQAPQLGLTVMLLPVTCSALLLFVSGVWFPPAATTIALAASSVLTLASSIKYARAERFRLDQRTRVALDAVADGVLTIGPAGTVEQANPVASTLLGRGEGELHGQTLLALFGEDSGVPQAFERCMRERQKIAVIDPVSLTHHGNAVVRIVIGPLLGPRNSPMGAVLALSDITESVAASERLAHQATHDALTGLPNRVLIHDRIERAVAYGRRAGGSVAVLFVDLDRFKRINDGLGHRMGDLALSAVAGRLRLACRAADTIGRWGGDEFIVVLSDPQSAEHADLVARKIVEVIAEPLIVEGTRFQLGASIGISIAPHDSVDADELLAMADIAMYQAKLGGGNTFEHVSADMNARSRERVGIETGLRNAIANGELILHYQPQVDLKTGRFSGMEALIRWDRPGHGLISPASFIPVAEESNLICPLGAWVLDEVARQIRAWMDQGCCPVTVAANVSARQCADCALLDVLADAIGRHAIPPGLLEIEITETTAMRDVEHVASLLAQVREMGVHIALDDFGTGYSSLSHLKRLSIGTLKIDRSFVVGAPREGDDAAISRATISLAHNLGMKVVAEGVETEAQREFLANEGCDLAQGYLFSRPLPAADMVALLSSRVAPIQVHCRRS